MPLIFVELQQPAGKCAGDNSSQCHCGSTNQWQFHRGNLAPPRWLLDTSASRVQVKAEAARRLVWPKDARFMFAAAERWEEPTSYQTKDETEYQCGDETNDDGYGSVGQRNSGRCNMEHMDEKKARHSTSTSTGDRKSTRL